MTRVLTQLTRTIYGDSRGVCLSLPFLLAMGMAMNFQLPVAVTLTGTGLLSLAFRGLSASERGKISLPIISDADGPLESRPDAFDVTKPEDIIDGEPINEAGFWINVSYSSNYARPVTYSMF